MDLLVLGYVISGKKVLTDIAISLARNNLPGLVSDVASNTITTFERK